MAERVEINLIDVVNALKLDVDATRKSVDITCPCCGNGNIKKKKMNLNFSKNVFRCNKCEISGGPLKLWGIFKNLPLDDNKELFKSFMLYSKDYVPLQQNGAAEEEETPIATIEIRDKTYKGLLSILQLSNQHKENLLNRGLSEEAIVSNGYKTYPTVGIEQIPDMLLQRGLILEGVPGFYQQNGQWKLREFGSGFLIPQKDGFGRIEGLQIRLDKGESRYLTVSSYGYDNGTQGHTYPHLHIGEKGLREVIITEGPLKGDIISYFSGYSVFAMPGVNALKYAKKPLLDLVGKGTQKFYIAFDSDLKTNEHVEKALKRLKFYLSQLKAPYQIIDWDSKDGKGLDDYLLKRKQNDEK